MLSEKKLAKVESKLAEIQKGCRSRVYDIEDIKKTVERVEKEVEKLPKWMYKHLGYSEFETVANSYRGIAEATSIAIVFTTTGTVKDVSVDREQTIKEPYGNMRRRLMLSRKAFEEHFEQEEISEKMLRHLYKSVGFTQNGYMDI